MCQTPKDVSESFYITKKKRSWAHIITVLSGRLGRAFEGFKAGLVEKAETPGLIGFFGIGSLS